MRSHYETIALGGGGSGARAAGSWLALAAVLAVAAASLLVGWTGYIASDDMVYAVGADGWITHFPYIGHTHWELRHAIVLPMALFFALAGKSETTLVLTECTYFLLLVTISYLALDRFIGRRSAIAAAILIAVTPVFSLNATVVATDLPEVVFGIGSLWAFYLAWKRNDSPSLLVVSGALVGVAWVTRETSVVFALFYAVLFVIGFGPPRLKYFWMAAGFLAVAGVDTIYLWAGTGDFLYRYHVSLGGISRDNPIDQANLVAVAPGFYRSGIVDAPRFLRPFSVLFLSHSFGLLFYIAVPLAVWLSFFADIPAHVRRLVRLLSGLGLLWFLVLSYGLMTLLWTPPRYESVAAACAALITGIWAGEIGLVRARRQTAVLAILLVATDLGFIYLDNKDILFTERALVPIAVASRETIYTDPATHTTAAFLLEAAGASDRVLHVAPPSGSLYYFNPVPRRGSPSPVQPAPTWEVVDNIREDTTLAAAFLQGSGILARLPVGLRAKLAPPPKVARLYRVR